LTRVLAALLGLDRLAGESRAAAARLLGSSRRSRSVARRALHGERALAIGGPFVAVCRVRG
jgi:hypothetical protein